MRDVKLNDLDAALDDLSYPATKADVQAEVGDVTLQYADGEERLIDVLDRVEAPVFKTPDDLRNELMNVLPVESVGEPGQSEGEG